MTEKQENLEQNNVRVPSNSNQSQGETEDLEKQSEQEKLNKKNDEENYKVMQYVGIYLIVSLSVLIAIGSIVYLLHVSSPLVKTVLYVGVSGGIGGVFYCIRGFIFHNVKNDFEAKWKWWYLYQPLTGFVFGILAYFLLVGGLLTLGSVDQVDYSKGILLYCSISFLAGFSTKKFTEKLDELASSIFSSSEKSAASETPVASFDVSGFPNPATSGALGSVTVTAKDAKGNSLGDYIGTVKITSSDKAALLPDDYKFQPSDKGTHKFNVTLNTTGTQLIKATDSADNSIIGSQTDITVKASSPPP